MSRATMLLLLGAAALLAPGATPAATPQEVSARAEELVRSGKAEEARALAAGATEGCPEGAAGTTCRQRLRFTLGWIAERRAASAAPGSTALLEEAARHYGLVLAEAPAHAATLANLAGVEARLGRVDRARELLERAALADPARTAAYALAQGDLERQAQRVDEARRAYERAIAADPTDDTARLRIVDLHADLKADAAPGLMGSCAGWEQVSLPAADAGYLAVIRLAHASSGALAEEALLRWVSTEARLGRLTSASADALPEGWKSAAVDDLRTFLRDPGRQDPARWWTSGPRDGPASVGRRQHVLAEAALALGRAARSRGEDGAADAIWSNALRFAPGVDDYRGPLRDAPVVRLDLVSELMLLFSDDPSLDAQASRFRVQETALFVAKSGAYGAGDLASIQRFHTVLGVVYARRKVWTSKELYRNAIFQLEHAISTAEQRALRERRFEAVPALRGLLAEGYGKLGQSARALTQLLLAARDNLDVDDLVTAERQLRDEAARRSSGEDARLRDQLLAILETRKAVPPGKEAEALAAIAPDRTPALFRPSTARLDPQFLARQRFKLFARIAETQRGKGTPLALEAAAKAIATAAENTVSLQGAGDLRRLEVTRAIIDTEGRISVPKVRTAPRRPTGAADGKTLPLVIGGSSAATTVRLDPDIVVAAGVVSAVGAETVRSPDVSLRVRAGEVEVTAPRGAPLDPHVVAKVRNVEGVAKVVERSAQ